MAQNNNGNLYGNWKLGIMILSIIPSLIIGTILVQYAWYFDSTINSNVSSIQFLRLSYLYSLLDSSNNLPSVVKMIGILSAKMLFILFYILFAVHLLSAYNSLKNQIAHFPLLLVECFIILISFILVISPESVIINFIFYILLLCDMIIILSYAFYSLKLKNEKG